MEAFLYYQLLKEVECFGEASGGGAGSCWDTADIIWNLETSAEASQYGTLVTSLSDS